MAPYTSMTTKEYRRLEDALEKAVWSKRASACVASEMVGDQGVWAGGLWATRPDQTHRIHAHWNKPRLSVDKHSSWSTGSSRGSLSSPGAPRLVHLSPGELVDLAEHEQEYRWALFEFVDIFAQEALRAFLDRWGSTLSIAHGRDILVPPPLDAIPLVNCLIVGERFVGQDLIIEPRKTLFIDDLISTGDEKANSWRTSANILWKVVRDPIKAALNQFYHLSGRDIGILSVARRLKTIDPDLIRADYLARGKSQPSERAIKETLSPPTLVRNHEFAEVQYGD